MTTMVQDTKKKALGRGLESLIPAAARAGAQGTQPAPQPAHALPGEAVIDIPVEEIEPSPFQPRRRRDQQLLQELAASIRVSGVMQPVVVRRIGAGTTRAPGDVKGGVKYQLIAGERRWSASKMAEKTTVPAIVREVSNEQAMELALVENLQREDLGPIEMAYAFDRLNRDFGLTQEQISQRTGKDRATIGNYLRLLKLGQGVQDALERGHLSFGHAKALLALESREMIDVMAAEIIKHGHSVRHTEEVVKQVMWGKPPDLSQASKPERTRTVDPNVRAAERQLEAKLGVRVRIRDRHGKGKVVIEYATLEDFDRIVEVLSK